MENNSSEKLDMLNKRILANVKQVMYGTVAVELKIHNGRIVSIIHAVTEKTKEDNNVCM